METLDKLFSEAKHLPPDDRLWLVHRIIQTLVSSKAESELRLLQFGEFIGDENSMATWEDFALAEWQPSEKEWDE